MTATNGIFDLQTCVHWDEKPPFVNNYFFIANI